MPQDMVISFGSPCLGDPMPLLNPVVLSLILLAFIDSGVHKLEPCGALSDSGVQGLESCGRRNGRQGWPAGADSPSRAH